MRRLRGVASLVGVLAVSFVVVRSAAAAPKVAALVPQVRPTAAPELRDRFHEAVTRGLQNGGEESIGAAEVRLRLGASEEMLGCTGAGPCVARVAQALSIDRAVATEIDVTGKDYAIKMRLVDSVGRELAKVDEPCDICTVKEAEDAVARAATKLATAAKSLPVESAPPTATTTPPKPEPTPPPKVEPAPSVEPTPAPAPETTPAVTAQPEKKPFPWRAVAISSLAVGLVGVVVGIPLIAIDGQPTCNLPNPKQSCADVYNTVGGGATLLTLGIAGMAASGVLFYFDHRARKKRAPAVTLLPLQGGFFVNAGGRF